MGQLHASRLMKKSEDPDVWISELEILRSRLNELGPVIDDEFLILHILNNLPSDYDNVVENLEERVDSVINPLGLEDVPQKLSEKLKKNEDLQDINAENFGIRRKTVAQTKNKIIIKTRRKSSQVNVSIVKKRATKK